MSKRSGNKSSGSKKSISKKVVKVESDDDYESEGYCSEECVGEQQSDVRQLKIKNIDKNGKYFYASYGTFKVIIDNKTGFINATKLCSLVKNDDGGITRPYKGWKRTDDSKELFEALAMEEHLCSADELWFVINGGKIPEVCGTYVHPDIIPHVAAWVSKPFAIKVSKIVNEFLINEFNKKLKEKDILIKKKDNEISRLSKKIDEQFALLNKKQDKMNKKQNKVIDQNKNLRKDTKTIINVLEESSKDRVVLTEKKSRDHILVILELNDNKKKFKYYIMRLMKGTLNSRISTMKKKHPNLKVFAQIETKPNSMNVWHRITDNYKIDGVEHIINDNGNYFNLTKDYTIKQFIKKIVDEYNKRLIDETNVKGLKCDVFYESDNECSDSECETEYDTEYSEDEEF